jgi:hypothetical protein
VSGVFRFGGVGVVFVGVCVCVFGGGGGERERERERERELGRDNIRFWTEALCAVARVREAEADALVSHVQSRDGYF